MNLARVTGTVVATLKDPSIEGQRLLLLQPLGPDGTDRGTPIVATDTVSSGDREVVVFVRGKEASFAHAVDLAGVVTDAAVVGIVERQHLPANFGKS
ncbi:MAG: EutN/CcmL family microcompartment protein [Acidobacteriota bacterium]